MQKKVEKMSKFRDDGPQPNFDNSQLFFMHPSLSNKFILEHSPEIENINFQAPSDALK